MWILPFDWVIVRRTPPVGPFAPDPAYVECSPVPEIPIAPATIPPGQIVTAQSYLIDRFVPDVEIIQRPASARAGGTLTWTEGSVTLAPPVPSGRLKSILPKRQRTQAGPPDRWLLDLRAKTPDNWAHFLNNHLPLAFGVADAAGRDLSGALVLLPKAAPGYILKVASLFGLTVQATDDVVTGEGLEVNVTPWTAIRAMRHRWAGLPGPRAVIADLVLDAPDQPLPKRVFLSRKTDRNITNIAEIEPILAARGFETIYPETLSPGDQLRLFLGADEMVAVHGAGLAPLLYCTPGQGLSRLIEILPCGHMTDVYREMAAQVGCHWIGVRGRLKPEYVQPAYMLDASFKAFSLDGFEVDPVALERAFDMSDPGAGRG